jgi:hypothetical protein
LRGSAGSFNSTCTTENSENEDAFRFEFFNAFNRVQFSAPGTQVDNIAAFGVVSGQANSPRQIQLALKLIM